MKGTRPQTVMTVKGPATRPPTNAWPRPAGHRHPQRGAPTRMTKWPTRWVQSRTQSLGGRTPGICLALSPTASLPRSTDPRSPSTSAPRPHLHPSCLPLCCHPRQPSPEPMTAVAGRGRSHSNADKQETNSRRRASGKRDVGDGTTHGHCNLETESAQWADSLKILL